MIIIKTKYERDKSFLELLIYVIFYTISFASILFYIWIPFDLLLVNLVIIQLPIILVKETTFHGFIAGNIRTLRG